MGDISASGRGRPGGPSSADEGVADEWAMRDSFGEGVDPGRGCEGEGVSAADRGVFDGGDEILVFGWLRSRVNPVVAQHSGEFVVPRGAVRAGEAYPGEVPECFEANTIGSASLACDLRAEQHAQ